MKKLLIALALATAPCAALAQGSGAMCASRPGFLGCLPAVTTLVRTNVVPVSQVDVARNATIAQILGLIQASDIATAMSGLIPSATTSKLYGGTGAAGAVAPITLGTNLSMSFPGGVPTLNAAGGGGLSSIANNTLLANTSGSSAVPISTTVSALLDASLGSTQGGVIYRGASSWAVLAPGTSGFVLQTNGASANPSWIGLSGGGTITGVTAGTGLTGGGTSGTVTVTLGQATTSVLGGVTFSATNPAAPGTAAPGSATSAARSDHVHPLPPNVSSGAAGLAPASGGGTTAFLRADGSWAVPPGTGGSGSTVPVTTVAASGTTQTISFPSSGSAAYDVTLTGNCVFSLSGGTAGQRQTITLYLRQDATAGRSPTLPTGVKWAGGIAPVPNTTAGVIDVFTFHTPDAGTTVFGSY